MSKGKTPNRVYETKYNQKVQEMSDDYVNRKINPMVTELATYIGINSDTIYEWEKKHVKFKSTLMRLRDKQKTFLIQDGLSKSAGQAMNIFLLKANHGMVETTRSEVTGADGQPLGVVIMPRIIEHNENDENQQSKLTGESKNLLETTAETIKSPRKK